MKKVFIYAICFCFAFWLGHKRFISFGKNLEVTSLQTQNTTTPDVQPKSENPVVQKENDITPFPSPSGLVKKIAPAIVEIHTTHANAMVNPFGNDPFFSFFFQPFGGQVMEQKASGSGVIIDPKGFIATCAHVVRNADSIMIHLADGAELKAEIALIDEKEDLALLKIPGEQNILFPFITLGSVKSLEVGDSLLAIGNAFGLGTSVTQGIVSAPLRPVEGRVALQTDASINPGNSGGALVNMKGELIAIPNAILSRSGASHGVGFGRPASIIAALYDEYTKGGKKTWFGVRGQTLKAEQIKSLGLKKAPFQGGVAVTYIHKQSPWVQAGLGNKDIIMAWNGQPVTDNAMLRYFERTTKIGETVNLEVWRAGNIVTLSCVAGVAPETQTAKYKLEHGLFKGLEVADIATLSADELESLPLSEGIMITSLGSTLAGSPFLQGFAVGDVIVSWNGNRIQTIEDLKQASSKPSSSFYIVIQRGRSQIALQIRA